MRGWEQAGSTCAQAGWHWGTGRKKLSGNSPGLRPCVLVLLCPGSHVLAAVAPTFPTLVNPHTNQHSPGKQGEETGHGSAKF